MALRVRVLRGTLAQIQAATFPAGQLVMATDTKQLYMFDGVTVGGTLVGLSQAAVQTLIDNFAAGLTINKISGLQAALDGKASAADLDALETALAGKADQTALDALATQVGTKATQADITAAIAGKADQTAVDALSTTVDGKADQTAVDTALAAKADKTALDTLSTTVDGKVDQAALDTALADKADQADVDALQTAVDSKAAQSSVDALGTQVASKANTADVNAALADKVAKVDLFEGDSGLIKSSLLPSYVDDVLEFANLAAFPQTAAAAAGDGGAESGKIYVALDTSKIYRWSGSTYIDLASPEILATASDAEATALAIDSKAVTPKNLAAVISMLGFVKDGDDWVLDEGQVA